MASTAAGVTVGSAVGHTMGAAITGGARGERGESVPHSLPTDQQTICQRELKEFLDCCQTKPELSMCYEFNEALKDCRRLFERSI